MKYLWVSSVFVAGLILSGGTAFAAGGNILSDRARNLSESYLLLADASLDLDITMEVVDEDVQSSQDITNVIELPIRSRYREMKRHQEQLGNGPTYTNDPSEGQRGPNPFLEGSPESRQQINRPSDSNRTKSVSSGDGLSRPSDSNRSRTDSNSGALNRPSDSNRSRTDSSSGGQAIRGDASGGPADRGTRSEGQAQKGEANKRGK